VLALCGRHQRNEELEPIPVRIENVDTLARDVVGDELGLRSMIFQAQVEPAQRFLSTLDLESAVAETGAADRLVVRNLG
jgi:hypothetical protein